MKNLIVEKEFEEYLKHLNLWREYKHDPVFNRTLEFDTKGNFAVTLNQKTIYKGTSLSDAVSAYNWMNVK
jgi:hypothetical protein